MSRVDSIITQNQLKEILRYDSKTGIFTWNVNKPRCFKGSVAGTLTKYGYIRIQIYGRLYMAHRLAWLYIYGCWPRDQLDHKNQIKSSNWISNLIESNNIMNQRNSLMRKDNTSGFTGVSWHKGHSKWSANIHIKGNNIALGCFRNKNDAIVARKKANREYGFSINHGNQENCNE